MLRIIQPIELFVAVRPEDRVQTLHAIPGHLKLDDLSNFRQSIAHLGIILRNG